MLKYKIPQIVTLIQNIIYRCVTFVIDLYLEGLQTKKAPFC